MKVNWDDIYSARGMFSGYGSRGNCAALKKRAIESVIEKLQPASILDVGCGDLYVMRQIDMSGVEYVGLDASTVSIDSLKRESLPGEFICGDFLDVEFTRTFDLVLCMDVLIHTQDIVEYRLIAEKLKSVSSEGLVVSGYAEDRPGIRGSSVVHFHESILETFGQYEIDILGQYRDTTLIFVNLEKSRNRRHFLWTYWETPAGGSRAPYLDLCEATWHRHCGDDFTVVKVTPETAREYAPDLIEEWDQIPCLAHKADYLRAVLVHRHGGIWLDADTIVLRNLQEMMDRLSESGSDFLGCGRPGKRPSNGIFAGAAGSRLLGQYIDTMDEFIRARKGDLRFKWTEIGYGLLWPLTREYEYFQYDFRVCIPVHPSRYRRLFDRQRVNELSAADCDIRDDTLTVYLYNSMFPGWFKRMRAANVARSGMVIGQLFRKALAIDRQPELIEDHEIFSELSRIKSRGQIPSILSAAGLNSRVCEIGVRTGSHLNAIVRGADPDEFVGIDSWTDDPVVSRNDSGSSQAQLDELELRVRQKFSKYGERGRIIRNYSFEEVKHVPDEYFDYVYIDADHSYEAVKRDIADWFPKVRPGGVLAGHDYVERRIGRCCYGVIRAVNEFVEQNSIRHFTVTDERFATWMIMKPSQQPESTFCYCSIGTGQSKYHAFLRTLVASARRQGVREDFHIWTDPGIGIPGAVVHEFDRKRHHSPGFMFKWKVLEAAQEYQYDYYVFLDSDNIFVRKPSSTVVNTMLRLADPFHATQESKINGDEFSRDQLREFRWWGVSLEQLIEAFHAKGLAGKRFYLNNGGFFVVKRDHFRQVYETVWEGFHYLRDELGYRSVVEECAMSYAMAKLTNPEGHRVIHKHVSDIWCTDRGNFRGRLPDGQPFLHWTNWDGVRFQVNPAIVHAMKSKPELIELANSSANIAKGSVLETSEADREGRLSSQQLSR